MSSLISSARVKTCPTGFVSLGSLGVGFLVGSVSLLGVEGGADPPRLSLLLEDMRSGSVGCECVIDWGLILRVSSLNSFVELEVCLIRVWSMDQW